MIATLLLLAPVLPAQYAFGDTRVQPTTYTSPAGTCELFIDPSDPAGNGPADYRLTRAGEVQWAIQLPFTLRAADVTDDGSSGGFATLPRSPDAPRGSLLVAVLSSAGEVLVKDVVERTESTFFHSSAKPDARSVFAHAEADRLVVLVVEEDDEGASEVWWTYRLSTGERLDDVRPKTWFDKQGTLVRVLWAGPIRETPLTLLQWFCYAPAGTRFAVVDRAWRPIWELDLPRDYELQGDEGHSLVRDIERDGAVLDVAQPQRFTVRLTADAERVTYEARETKGPAQASASAGGELWDVVELEREPYVPPAPPADHVYPEVAARLLSSATLDSTPPAGPIRDVAAFEVDATGEIELVRSNSGGLAIMTLAADGSVVREAELDVPQIDGQRSYARLAPGRWVVVASDYSWEEPSRAWIADSRTGALEALTDVTRPKIAKVTATPDGGFVAIGDTSWMAAYDASGRERWLLDGNMDRSSRLKWAHDVDVLPDGRIVAITPGEDALQVYAADGRHVRDIDLARALKQNERNLYLSHVVTLPDGEVLVGSNTVVPSPWWRMSSDGGRLGRFDPRFEDGARPRRVVSGLRSCADGRLWSSDGQSLYRFDERGVVDRVVGRVPGAGGLRQPGAATLDTLGRVCIQDLEGGAVYVFDPSGAVLAVGRPEPNEFRGASATARLTVAPDGTIYVQDYKSALVFGADGERAGSVELEAARVLFDPASSRRWLHGNTLQLVDADGQTLRTIERNPDRTWLQGTAAVDGSGNLAVVSRSHVALYDRNGELEDSFAVELSVQAVELSYASGWLAVTGFDRHVDLIRIADRSLWRFEPEASEASQRVVVRLTDAGELWALDRAERTLTRYALPAR